MFSHLLLIKPTIDPSPDLHCVCVRPGHEPNISRVRAHSNTVYHDTHLLGVDVELYGPDSSNLA